MNDNEKIKRIKIIIRSKFTKESYLLQSICNSLDLYVYNGEFKPAFMEKDSTRKDSLCDLFHSYSQPLDFLKLSMSDYRLKFNDEPPKVLGQYITRCNDMLFGMEKGMERKLGIKINHSCNYSKDPESYIEDIHNYVFWNDDGFENQDKKPSFLDRIKRKILFRIRKNYGL